MIFNKICFNILFFFGGCLKSFVCCTNFYDMVVDICERGMVCVVDVCVYVLKIYCEMKRFIFFIMR